MLLVVNKEDYENLKVFEDLTEVKTEILRKNNNGFFNINIEVPSLVRFAILAGSKYKLYQEEQYRLSHLERDLTSPIWISHDGVEKEMDSMVTPYMRNAIYLLIRDFEEEDLRQSTLFHNMAVEYVLRLYHEEDV